MAWDSASGGYVQHTAVMGSAYCIDPRFIAANSASPVAASNFPYPTAPAGPRMARITLNNGAGSAMGQLQADSIFTFADDLTFERADDQSLPATQSYYLVDHDADTSTPMVPMNRNNEGMMSWMATLVPKYELYAPGAAIEDSDIYVLSIVVFHQRPADMDPDNERVVSVETPTDLGPGGGEALLYWPPTPVADTTANSDLARQQLKLRANDWIMLSGNASTSGGATRPMFKWYRVTGVDSEPEYHAATTGSGHYEIQVSLSGQDWDPTLTSQQATIVEGVVGVYEKTVRLE
jgi:hypothetical protein